MLNKRWFMFTASLRLCSSTICNKKSTRSTFFERRHPKKSKAVFEHCPSDNNVVLCRHFYVSISTFLLGAASCQNTIHQCIYFQIELRAPFWKYASGEVFIFFPCANVKFERLNCHQNFLSLSRSVKFQSAARTRAQTMRFSYLRRVKSSCCALIGF